LREIIVCLHPQPRGRAAADGFFEPHGHFRRYGAPAVENPVKLLPAHAQAVRRFGYGQPQFLNFVPNQTTGMRWILHGHFASLPSVVVHKIDIKGIATFRPKHNPPVCAHGHRPKAFPIADEMMETERRHIHIADLLRSVQQTKNVLYSLSVLRIDASCIIVSEKTPQPVVAKTSDHPSHHPRM
jgi:hypothetical protein